MGFNFQKKPSKPVRGGGGHMVGKTGANPVKPGKVNVNSGGMSKSPVRGGKGKMFGFSGSKPSKAC